MIYKLDELEIYNKKPTIIYKCGYITHVTNIMFLKYFHCISIFTIEEIYQMDYNSSFFVLNMNSKINNELNNIIKDIKDDIKIFKKQKSYILKKERQRRKTAINAFFRHHCMCYDIKKYILSYLI